MDNEQIRAIEKAARYANNPWPSNGEVRAFRDIATPHAVLELISLTRATEAKPSASAAPGMEFPEAGVYVASSDGVARDSITDRIYEGDELYTPDQMRAAIAAAREEGLREGTEDGLSMQMLRPDFDRARLAAPEGWLPDLARVTPEMRKRLDDMMTEVAATGKSIDVLWQLLGEPQAKAPQQPPSGEDAIVAAVHAASATGRIALTVTGPDGIERPTNVATCFVRALARTTK